MIVARFLLVLLALSVSGQQLQCNVGSGTYSSSITIGNPFVLCVHFVDSLNVSRRAAFPITVDKYTALELPGVYNLISPNSSSSENITVQAQNSQIVQKSIYYTNNTNKVAQLLSYVIYVNNGVVERIDDDNSAFCDNCQGSCIEYAIDNNSTTKNCFVDTTTQKKDPKILVSWMGTDSTGQYLLSQTQRISKFTEYSINNVFESALNIFN